MAKVIRVSLPYKNVLTETSPNNIALKSDENSILIKEKERGRKELAYTVSSIISHNLSYIPFCLVWGQDINGNLVYGGITNVITAQNQWQVEIDSANLEVTQLVDTTGKIFLYYIFYDSIS